MRPFQFAAPATLAEAILVMSKAQGAAKPLVGGTDLIAQMKENRRTPGIVVDVKRIPEMRRLAYERDGLHIGAAVPCFDTYEHPDVQKLYPAVFDSARLVGSIQIQNRASIGGNVCNASPSADTVPALLVYEGRAVIVGPKGRREVPLDGFFTGPGRSVLAPEELLLEIVLPPPSVRSSSHYQRFIPREEMDIAVAGVASLLALDAKGVCTRARIALAAVAPTPLRAKAAEAALEGKRVTPALLREAAEVASKAAKPISDVRGSAEYRVELVKVLTRRTLEQCVQDLKA